MCFRELVEVKGSDPRLGFHLNGFITNANYSCKKGVMLLFINREYISNLSISTGPQHSEFASLLVGCDEKNHKKIIKFKQLLQCP